MIKNSTSIKYTATIPVQLLDTLKQMAEDKEVQSVNSAIREALGMYINAKQDEIYMKQMEEAAEDKKFLERTIKASEDFQFADKEVDERW